MREICSLSTSATSGGDCNALIAPATAHEGEGRAAHGSEVISLSLTACCVLPREEASTW